MFSLLFCIFSLVLMFL